MQLGEGLAQVGCGRRSQLRQVKQLQRRERGWGGQEMCEKGDIGLRGPVCQMKQLQEGLEERTSVRNKWHWRRMGRLRGGPCRFDC